MFPKYIDKQRKSVNLLNSNMQNKTVQKFPDSSNNLQANLNIVLDSQTNFNEQDQYNKLQ